MASTGLVSSDWRSTMIWSPLGPGAQGLLLELGLLHQPVDEAAQQDGLRPAALQAARPQARLVGEQLGDAALADALEDEERPVGDAGHHDLGVGRGLDVDLAEPLPPGGLRLLEAGRDRVALAEVGEGGRVGALDHLARGRAGRTRWSGVR